MRVMPLLEQLLWFVSINEMSLKLIVSFLQALRQLIQKGTRSRHCMLDHQRHIENIDLRKETSSNG